jgi:hypothetical protein
MTRLAAGIFILGAAASCLLSMAAKPSASPVGDIDTITVFLTGNELGALKPCGCSGGQLGGLDRRGAILSSVSAPKRIIVDTGSFIQGEGQQDLIKFDILMEAFSRLGYDVVNLTEKDILTAANHGLLDGAGLTFDLITAQSQEDANVPSSFTKEISLTGRAIAVTIAGFGVTSTPVEQIEELFSNRSGTDRANILILNQCDEAVIDSISRMGTVDCLVCPSDADEPILHSAPDKSPLVFSVGRYGKYVTKLLIKPAQTGQKLTFSFSAVPVTEDLTPQQSIVDLYEAYKMFVREAGLLEKNPRYVLPNGLKYVGSESCSPEPCHGYEYEKWSTKKHAHAYATLADDGYQYDPECIVCHVVGYEYESGYVSEEKTPHLKNVGCENCHGPGSKHVKSPLLEKTTQPMSDCTDCHTPEHSAAYGQDPNGYFERIVHWREQNAVGNVK